MSLAALVLAALLAAAPAKVPPAPKCSPAAALYCPGWEPAPLCGTPECSCVEILVRDRCGVCLRSYELCIDR